MKFYFVDRTNHNNAQISTKPPYNHGIQNKCKQLFIWHSQNHADKTEDNNTPPPPLPKKKLYQKEHITSHKTASALWIHYFCRRREWGFQFHTPIASNSESCSVLICPPMISKKSENQPKYYHTTDPSHGHWHWNNPVLLSEENQENVITHWSTLHSKPSLSTVYSMLVIKGSLLSQVLGHVQ